MPAPVISTTSSALSYGVGQDFVFIPSATNSPITWALEENQVLPAGVFFSPTNGALMGSGRLPGVYSIRMIASNADGDSAPATFILGIFTIPLARYSKKAVIDTTSLKVYCYDGIVGAGGGASVATDTFAKYGDTLVWKVEFAENVSTTGVVTTFTNPAVALIRFGLRKDEESPILMQSDYVAYKGSMVLRDGLYYPEHYVFLPLEGDALKEAVIENQGADAAFADILGEFEISFVSPENFSGPLSAKISTKTFKIRIAKDIVESQL